MSSHTHKTSFLEHKRSFETDHLLLAPITFFKVFCSNTRCNRISILITMSSRLRTTAKEEYFYE